MEGILRLREIVYQLRKRLTLVESKVESIIGGSQIIACSDHITFQNTKDGTYADMVILKQNAQGDTANYWPVTTASPANGITIIQDAKGNKFELVR